MHYIGVDSGGTKTAFTLFDDDLARVDTLRLGTTHFQQVGYDGMERLLAEGIDELVRRNDVGEFGVGFGIAGFGEEASVADRIRESVARVAGERPFTLMNDGEAALAASLALGDGIVLSPGRARSRLASATDGSSAAAAGAIRLVTRGAAGGSASSCSPPSRARATGARRAGRCTTW